eukprot:SM007966S22529  [mRNA]  locus=s7966:101:631:+ [translate_table: standard]
MDPLSARRRCSGGCWRRRRRPRPTSRPSPWPTTARRHSSAGRWSGLSRPARSPWLRRRTRTTSGQRAGSRC